MNKLLVTMLTLLTCGAAYALPVGNPADPMLLTQGVVWDGDCAHFCDSSDPSSFDWDLFSVRAGYYGDFNFDRQLRTSGVSHDNRIDRTEIYTNAGLITLNVWNRIDLFTTLGGTNMNLDARSDVFGLGTTGRVEVQTDSEFSWSVGARVLLLEFGCTSIGFEGQYFKTQPNVRRITEFDTASIYPDDTTELRYHEWQVGLGISHRINMLVPYFAVKYSDAHARFNGTPGPVTFEALSLPSLKERNHWGYALGVSLVDLDMMSLNVEGRFGDEKALSVTAEVRF